MIDLEDVFEFAVWLTGHDKETIQQMYNDYFYVKKHEGKLKSYRCELYKDENNKEQKRHIFIFDFTHS